jgi:hypothetical protein
MPDFNVKILELMIINIRGLAVINPGDCVRGKESDSYESFRETGRYLCQMFLS